MDLRTQHTREDRRTVLEQACSISLFDVFDSLRDDERDIHCENLLGAVTIPLGVAGPMRITGDGVRGEYVIPLATTEGALVASVNRGMKAASAGQGIRAHVQIKGATRGPLFRTSGIAEGDRLCSWLMSHMDELNEQAQMTSRHVKLIDIKSRLLGKSVYVRFAFDTGDAMGMNMATIATTQMVEYISAQTGIACLAVAGNFDIDKKPAWMNSIDGRGTSCWAETIIPADQVKSILKVTPEQITDIVMHKSWGGSMMSGSLGFNAHFANIAAAFFIATGQDPAHVVEASQGITSASVQEDDSLYFSVYLPSVMLGIVGGGTQLKTQKQARSIMRVKSSVELAILFSGAVLAGELSLHASIAEGSLARVHTQLGRTV